MRTIPAAALTEAVAALCIEANTRLPADVQAALDAARAAEPWPLARNTLDLLWSNLGAAREAGLPICQDTGMACVFVELGTEVHIEGDFEAAIHEGVRRGYTDGYLRKSIVADPLRRGNTGDNTPAAITVHLVNGDGCQVTVAPKGFGSENMSRIAMLKPADGVEGFKRFVVDTVQQAGSNPCPPVILGVGVGGSFDKVAYLAKKALLRPWTSPTPTPITPPSSGSCWRRSTPSASGRRASAGVPPAWAWPSSRCPPTWPACRPRSTSPAMSPAGPRRNCKGGRLMEYKLTAPCTAADLAPLRAGDTVLLSGVVYTARDQAHKRMMEALDAGEALPFPLEGSAIYYVGPTPERPGQVIGSAGPTTSGRMDSMSPRLLDLGNKIMIGKGKRDAAVKAAVRRNGAVYLAALGGAGALMARSVRSLEVIAWPDLGCEAVRRLEVTDMPLTVILDSAGGDLYESGPAAYLASRQGPGPAL